jgi:ATP-dependent 26S proteasome regulatory subunit
MKSEVQRITHESRAQRDRIRENQDKVKLNKQLPYLVANVVEVLEPDAEDGACVRAQLRPHSLPSFSIAAGCALRCGMIRFPPAHNSHNLPS